MHWIAPTEKDAATTTLEERLWQAADQLRANSGLKAQEYSRPLNDPSPRMHAVFSNPPRPPDGLFRLRTAPGLGLDIDAAALAQRRVDLP